MQGLFRRQTNLLRYGPNLSEYTLLPINHNYKKWCMWGAISEQDNADKLVDDLYFLVFVYYTDIQTQTE